MVDLSAEQIRLFRLHAHHLDAVCPESETSALVGACGMQNSPPGTWETALFNRMPTCSRTKMKELLYTDKILLQAWSFRGAPVVFPAAESDVFLAALIPEYDEPWIYTRGIGLALDFLQIPFDELLEGMRCVMPRLDQWTISSKTALDQTIADWMMPFLPADKQVLWRQPSMYGSPDKQTVGGAVVSFLLRPCALEGRIVFGRRDGDMANGTGGSPTFTSYRGWTGHEMRLGADAAQKLVRKYLHCYGPATVSSFTSWLGCSGRQGRRIWQSAAQEMEPVMALGQKAYILSSDKEYFASPAPLRRELLMLGPHDPYLDQRDRLILQQDKSLHSQIWKNVANPGAIVYQGEIVGVWTGKKNGNGIEIKTTWWTARQCEQQFPDLAEAYAAFRGERLMGVE